MPASGRFSNSAFTQKCGWMCPSLVMATKWSFAAVQTQ